MRKQKFDIIVVGGGHAGVEAAYIASQFKELDIAIITLESVPIASAPCNPSIGGVGKGQVVRELDALGGLMPRLADLSGIQFRTLNESKGPAVQSTRVQIDKEKYSFYAFEILNQIKNITIIYDKISNIRKQSDLYHVLGKDFEYISDKLIVTVGTFLQGSLHVGNEVKLGGRRSCESSTSMSGLFKNIKTISKRFKTGTPPRLKRSSIDFSKLEEQKSDNSVRNFSSLSPAYERNLEQLSCYLTYTNEKTTKLISNNLSKSPMYNGLIKGVGARYCPSIEDKVSRYPDKSNHHIFVEPEGINSNLIYPSGISSSLPRDVQELMVNSIAGLETAEISEYGYAVEYDVIDTTKLTSTLMHNENNGLYFAGQINGTSGYEEAAAQGYIAGVNAALAKTNSTICKKLVLDRNDSYIGVLIDDLVSNLRDEPYRLFTARAENRLYLREDNSILRMSKYREQLNLNMDIDKLNSTFVKLYSLALNGLSKIYIDHNSDFIKQNRIKLAKRSSLLEVLRRSDVRPVELLSNYFKFVRLNLDDSLLVCLAISNKYSGYIKKSEEKYSKVAKLDIKKINYEKILHSKNISFECKRRIEHVRPENFGQLRRIEGIRPATLAVIAGQL